MAHRLLRLAALVLAAAVVAGATAENARTALFFLFEPTEAKPGDLVTIRTGGTPASFTLRQRIKPFQRGIRLYLVPNTLADDVHSRYDTRLHFIGSLEPDARGRGLLTFTVPPLDSNGYAVAAWCPGCAPYSRGRTFFVLRVDENIVPRYRPLMLLRVTAPPATETCPVTLPNRNRPPGMRPGPNFHGNGALWAVLPLSGAWGRGDPFNKQIWFAAGTPRWADLVTWIERLDVPGPRAQMLTVRGWPENSGFRGSGSWAARLRFPSEGCYRVIGRVRDIALSFVVQVVAGS